MNTTPLDRTMNDRSPPSALTLSIAAVERDTGLSKDTLRVWERRYGFPQPERDDGGERAYPLDQVEKLRLLKRLLDAGHRPGRVVRLSSESLQALAESTVDLQLPSAAATAWADADVQAYLALMASHDVTALRRRLLSDLARVGMTRFLADLLTPLNRAVGEAWMRGQLQIFEEHAYTESLQCVLRHALVGLPSADPDARPRVLLATLPGEPHSLGLLMAEAMLAIDGLPCTSMGVQLPVWDLVLAAKAYRSDVVALGFTGCANPTQTIDALQELRSKLPPTVAVWAGGSMPVLQRRRIEGVWPMAALADMPAAVEAWRSRQT
jgi:DNA-binding transcriptional MerR regulator/methylmalonyl-CoA mutase cobalamin-binding subunit